MTRYHGTPDGDVPFTDAEEAERDAEEQAWTREQTVLAIQNRRASAILAFSYGGHPFPLTARTQQDVANAAAALKRLPQGSTVEWEIADGVYVPMDVANLEALGDAAFAHIQTCFANSKRLTVLAQAGEAYDLESGWPQ